MAVTEWPEPWGESSPCSGFAALLPSWQPGRAKTQLCAGYRQCQSKRGIGSNPWNVPLEVRCTEGTEPGGNTSWGAPEYLFDVFFNRALPYDPVRPWVDEDGRWYTAISMDGCNGTARGDCASKGGRMVLWSATVPRGPAADWALVGMLFESNKTVLTPKGEGSVLDVEFVTSNFFGAVPGDPLGGRTRVFTNNVGGVGCCSGTTGFFLGTQSGPGAQFLVNQSSPHHMGMLDWAAFLPDQAAIAKGAKGAMALIGTGTRGFSMARTLGSPDANQVLHPGRRVVVGWLGTTPAMQSLPRDISLSSEGELLQAFVPELKTLRRQAEPHPGRGAGGALARSVDDVLGRGLQLEVVVDVLSATANDTLGIVVQEDPTKEGASGVKILVDPKTELLHVGDRAGPLPPAGGSGAAGWRLHVFVDGSSIEVICNNRTALAVQVPARDGCMECNQARLLNGTMVGSAVAWPLDPI